MLGRVLISQAEGMSRLVYLPTPQLKTVQQPFYQFLWNNKSDKISRKVLCQDYINGGLKAVHFTDLNHSLKLVWLFMYFSPGDSFWKLIPNQILATLGGLRLLTFCNFLPKKLGISLPSFYNDILDAWKTITQEDKYIYDQIIWNNYNLLIQGKSFFFQGMFDKGIQYVRDLFDQRGNVLRFIELRATCGIESKKRTYNSIRTAVLKGVRNQPFCSTNQEMDLDDTPCCEAVKLDVIHKSKVFCNILQNQNTQNPH